VPTNFADIETPALVVDLDIMERNLERAATYAASHGLALRPHVKTHKSPVVAARQVALGASGLTCATPFEAEVMSVVTHDIVVAYPPVGAARANRLASLPADVNLIVALDSELAIRELSRAAAAASRSVGVYVELDVGMHRVGVPGVEDGIALARLVRDDPHLEFTGIAFYPGHVREPVNDQDGKLASLGDALTDAAAAVRAGRALTARRERRIHADTLAHA
jgi:Predicted amino acid aldolase or racemase